MGKPTDPRARSQSEDMELALDMRSPLSRAARAESMPAVEGRRPSDEQLLDRVGDGDRRAFEVLYKRYARPVLGLALRRLGDRGRAEDAVQEAFTSIWRSAATFDPDRIADALGPSRPPSPRTRPRQRRDPTSAPS